MSRLASRSRALAAGLGVAMLALAAPLAGAQTITDYSHAQRVALENAMAQVATRAAGLAAASPAAAATSAPPPASAPLHPMSLSSAPDVQVSGVFASGSGAVAEVIVNSTPYLLSSGEHVPGTGWDVRLVAIDRVVLGRHGGVSAADASGGQRVFALPALR